MRNNGGCRSSIGQLTLEPPARKGVLPNKFYGYLADSGATVEWGLNIQISDYQKRE